MVFGSELEPIQEQLGLNPGAKPKPGKTGSGGRGSASNWTEGVDPTEADAVDEDKDLSPERYRLGF